MEQTTVISDKTFLKEAINQAKKSVEEGGFPAGSILVKDGEIIAEGVSLGYKLNDPTSHSDTACIRKACKDLETTDLSGITLYSSIQPCLMCFSGANWAGIFKIVYGCKKTEEMVKKFYYEGSNNIDEINKNNTRQIELVYLPDFESEINELIKQWEIKNNL